MLSITGKTDAFLLYGKDIMGVFDEVKESWKGAVRMQEEKAVENKENYIDGGNFKARIGNTTYLVGVFFNKAKKVTVEDRVKNLICEEVVAGNF